MFPKMTPIEGLRLRQLLDGHLHSERVSLGVAYNGAAAIGGTMPAEHGTRLLRLVNGEVEEAPVERWLIGAGAVPVTSAGPQSDRDYVVEFGSGMVIAPGAGAWQTRDEWLASTKPPHPHAGVQRPSIAYAEAPRRLEIVACASSAGCCLMSPTGTTWPLAAIDSSTPLTGI